jgi:hypothetical protein
LNGANRLQVRDYLYEVFKLKPGTENHTAGGTLPEYL